MPDVAARARLYGEPMLRMPTDLFIPPDALEIFLDAFEGPLDLLLYLIRKQNFNILDIPMAQVTLQYLKYVDQIRLHNLELAAEYLLMAAMLIEIKSRMLLPQRKADDDEAGDPRAELVRRLLEYEQIKVAAYDLNAMPQVDRDFTRPQLFVEQSNVPTWPDVDAADLQRAWLDVLKRATLTQHHKISRQELSVREHMSAILRQLQSARFVEFCRPVRRPGRRADRRRPLRRHARTGQRNADRNYPGRAVCADLRAARLFAGLTPAPYSTDYPPPATDP